MAATSWARGRTAGGAIGPGPLEGSSPRSFRRRRELRAPEMSGAETRCRGFFAPVTRANIRSEPAWTSDASGAGTPHIGRCEMAPTTAPRANPQTLHSRCFRHAYGPDRSRAWERHCSTATESPDIRTAVRHYDQSPLSVSPLTSPNDSHHSNILYFSTESLPKPISAGPNHDRRHDEHASCGRTRQPNHEVRSHRPQTPDRRSNESLHYTRLKLPLRVPAFRTYRRSTRLNDQSSRATFRIHPPTKLTTANQEGDRNEKLTSA